MFSAFFPNFFQNLIWLPTQFLLRLFGHFKVLGSENLANINGSIIFVANHTSELDPILLPAAMPFLSHFLPMFYVSREKTFYNTRQILKRIFYGGKFFELWGAYQTNVGLHNYEISLKIHIDILNSGHSLLILPEGEKSSDGILHEARGGAAFLSHRTETPIVPVAISGAFKITLIDFFLFRKHLTLSFGKPIYPAELFEGRVNIKPHEYKVIMNQVIMPRVSQILLSSR